MAIAIDDYRWLVSEAATPWLARAAESAGPSVQWIERLRKDLSADRAALVVEQAELRRRARTKFSLADKMFFTAQGLEQATDERLADYKAGRFIPGAAVADLCCGIGGDLMALAKRGPGMGIDVDPKVVLLANANLSVAGGEGSARAGDATNFSVSQFSQWHCDPDRRASGRRTTRVEQFSPPLESFNRLFEEQPSAAFKLAPATVAPQSWVEQAELEWLGSRRECRQQVAWFGSLARHAGRRAATIVEKDAVRTIVGDASDEMPMAGGCRRYVFEPHAAVLAAKLTSALCAEHGLAAVSTAAAYLTSDSLVADAALDAFEVGDVLPFDRKRLKAYCREHHLGRLEVKKRGVQIEPNRLVRELGSSGDEQAVILLAPVSGRVVAIVARRVR